MAPSMRPARTNILNLQQKTIRSHHPQRTRQTHRLRIQRLTTRTPTLHRRTLPQILGKHPKWTNLRQLHSKPRRNKRNHLVRPRTKTKRNPHHQRTPLPHLHQTHLHIRNHTPHTLPRHQLQTMEHLRRPTTHQQNQNHNHPPTNPPHHHPQPHPKPILTQHRTHITKPNILKKMSTQPPNPTFPKN